jgi:hypothetical protein
MRHTSSNLAAISCRCNSVFSAGNVSQSSKYGLSCSRVSGDGGANRSFGVWNRGAPQLVKTALMIRRAIRCFTVYVLSTPLAKKLLFRCFCKPFSNSGDGWGEYIAIPRLLTTLCPAVRNPPRAVRRQKVNPRWPILRPVIILGLDPGTFWGGVRRTQARGSGGLSSGAPDSTGSSGMGWDLFSGRKK